jgi:citrate lyase beta subunit
MTHTERMNEQVTRTVLSTESTADLVADIEATAATYRASRPGDPTRRQPVHTVYVPADRFDTATVRWFGREARRLLDAHAPDAAALIDAIGIPANVADSVRARVVAKLAAEPVEDLRIDFEDGYGRRDDDVEDADAARTARAIAHLLSNSAAPPFCGLRIKSFADGEHPRAIRTLDVFLGTLLDAAGTLPEGLLITFPKVVAPAHVANFATLLERLERALGLPERSLVFEVQVETTASIIDRDGRVALPGIAEAAAGRIVGAHFGVFDYTAACGLTGHQQRMDHPACDFARHVMQVSLAGTGIQLSDGATNRVPANDDTAAVTAVWRHHADLVRRSLTHGFYQGWDMHPAHLVSRFAAVFAFHRDHLEETTHRLANRASTSKGGSVLEEPATIQALLTSLRRAIDCGAIDETTALSAARLDQTALR